MRIAVYPGSFDPLTNGHLDVVARAAAVFDRVVFAVLANPSKSPPLFSVEERVAIIREAVGEGCPADVAGRIEVDSFEGLMVDFARKRQARFVVRGLRAISDFESELQMAHMNRKLEPDLDTVFFMSSIEYSYLSSSLVKEVAGFGGDVRDMVPAAVARRLGRGSRL